MNISEMIDRRIIENINTQSKSQEMGQGKCAPMTRPGAIRDSFTMNMYQEFPCFKNIRLGVWPKS